MRFHTSDVFFAPPLQALELFTKNGYPFGFDRVAPFAGAIPNSDEIGQSVCRESSTGYTSQAGIGKCTTKIFGIGAIGQFYGNFALDAIARTQLRNRTHFEKVLKLVAAIDEGNIGAVFAAQIPIPIRKRKAHFDGIERNAPTAALINISVADADVLDHGFNRELRRIGASTYQQHQQKAGQEIFRRFHHNCYFWP